MLEHSAASGARSLLRGAAHQLGTADPVDELGDVLDESLARPARGTAYRRTLEPVFDEASAGTLAFVLLPGGPSASARDRVATATTVARRTAGRNFGRAATYWLDSHLQVADDLGRNSSTWGASLGSGFVRDGALDSTVHLEWGPQLMESLAAPLHRLVQVIVDAMPALRPAFYSVRAGRHGGSQQVTFEVPHALPLDRLRPLMERLGLGHQHASLVSAVALLLGARYTLPPDAAMLTVRLGRRGVELRVDVDLDAIPDPPPEMTRLLRMQMSERPRSMRAFRRWVAALTPDGYDGPGRLSVLTVAVRPDRPARLALHLSPGVIERPPVRDEVPASAWLPVAGAAP